MFDVMVFNTCGYEINYAEVCKNNVNLVENVSASGGRNSSTTLRFTTSSQLDQNKAVASITVNTYAYKLPRIEMIIKPSHLFSNTNFVVCTVLIILY